MRLFIYSLQRAAFTKIALGYGNAHLRSARKAPVPSVPLLGRRTTDFFLILWFLFFRAFFFSRWTFASPLKIGRIEPALRTEVQHAQIHRLVSFGHRLLCEKIPSAKKPCRPILFSHFCFRCERRCGRSSRPLCFSYPRRPSLLVPVNTRAHARTAICWRFLFFLLHQPSGNLFCNESVGIGTEFSSPKAQLV